MFLEKRLGRGGWVLMVGLVREKGKVMKGFEGTSLVRTLVKSCLGWQGVGIIMPTNGGAVSNDHRNLFIRSDLMHANYSAVNQETSCTEYIHTNVIAMWFVELSYNDADLKYFPMQKYCLYIYPFLLSHLGNFVLHMFKTSVFLLYYQVMFLWKK